MKLNPKALRLYAVTAEAASADVLLAQVSEAIDGGARIVQLREKKRKGEALLALARRFAALCRERGALSIINDDAEVCLASGADGVHLGQGDMDLRAARDLLGPDRLIGVSAHNVEEAKLAEAGGADYLGSGAAFATGTKRDARPIGPEAYRAITGAVSIPVVAIGGVNGENMRELAGRGLAGAAVVSAIFGAADVKSETRRLRALADSVFAEEGRLRTALSIAGSDPTGGAGIQADLKTMTMNGVFAMSAITAMVAENTLGVAGIQESTPEFLELQLDCVFTDIYPDAVKVGMVSSEPLIRAIAGKLRRYGARHVVVDPVMVATAGSALMEGGALGALKRELLPLAEVITPNIPEAGALSGMEIRSASDMERAAGAIFESCGAAVLVKGGHALRDANDYLYSADGGRWFEGRRIDNPNTHGTGCTLSSAIAANLAKGYALEASVARAKEYLSGALSAMLDLGGGSGPMDHAFRLDPALRRRAEKP